MTSPNRWRSPSGRKSSDVDRTLTGIVLVLQRFLALSTMSTPIIETTKTVPFTKTLFCLVDAERLTHWR